VSWSNGGVLLAIVLIASGTTHLARKMAVLRRDNKLRPLRKGRKQLDHQTAEPWRSYHSIATTGP